MYGQMNEPPGARARVALTGLTVAEYFRDVEGQDVLLFIDNIFRFTQAGSEVRKGCVPSSVMDLERDILGLLHPKECREDVSCVVLCTSEILPNISVIQTCRQWLPLCMVPTRTGKQGKPGKMGRHFPVREFCQDWKVREFYSKYWKNWKKLYWKIEKKEKYWTSQGNLSASNSENPANMVPYSK